MVGIGEAEKESDAWCPETMISSSLEKLFYMSAASCWSPHPQPFSTPCREKASWALSFHLCQPPPAPLLNEGHFKHRFSLHSSQLLLLQGHALLVWRMSSPPPQPLSAPSRWEGPAASLGQWLPPFIQTAPLLPVEWSSRQHCPPPSSVSAGPSPSVG